MTLYEFIHDNRALLRVMAENGIYAGDVQYLSLYSNYMQMKKEGHKLMYIVGTLCDEYNVSEATVYRVLKRFKKVIA